MNRLVSSKKQSKQGRLGKIVLCDTQIKWWRTQEYYDSGAWRGTWDLDGGGALMNQSIHTIDLMLHLMGDVSSVSASGDWKPMRESKWRILLLQFLNSNQVPGVIQASTACYSNDGLPASIHICGDQGLS